MASRAIYTPVGAVATQVYVPASVGRPHAFIFNTGPSTVYIGGAGVTPSSGMPLPPQMEIDLSNGVNAMYAVAGGNTLSATATTNLTAAATGGGTTNLSVGTTANFAAGNIVQVGTGNTAESGTIASFATGPIIVLASAVVYDHRAGAQVATVTGTSTATVKTVAGAT